jgi:hypothetical protein
MTTPRLLLPVSLVVLAIAALLFGWNRHLKAIDLALALEELRLEQAELRAELREARQSGLRVNAAPSSVPVASVSANAAPPAPSPPAGPVPRDMTEAFVARLQNPEFQAAQIAQARAQLDGQYAELFRRLNLPTAQLNDLRNLLVDRRTASTDVLAAATAAGLNLRENAAQIAELTREAQAEIDTAIAATLGPEAFATYQFYQQTPAQRLVVSQLEQRLSYSTTPLTEQQRDQLIRALWQNAPDAQRTNPQNVVVNFAMGGTPVVSSGPLVTDAAIAQAAAILSPAQLEALREIQAAQAALGLRSIEGQPGQIMIGAPAVRLPGGG